MGIDTTGQREPNKSAVTSADKSDNGAAAQPDTSEKRPSPVAQFTTYLGNGFRQLEWVKVLIFGVICGVLMPLSFLNPALSLAAGIIPVGAGLILGRRVKGFYGLHGFMAGVVGAIITTIVFGVMIFQFSSDFPIAAEPGVNGEVAPVTPEEIWTQFSLFLSFSLITFCTLGAVMAGRSEERNRVMREQVRERGGQLQRAGAIRDRDDIRGLSLPQFGWYVNNVFKKNGFQFKDYRFIDKDKHLDLWMEHEGETWHLRLTVADKVGSGTVEGLTQELKREGLRKGVVLTSTEFQPNAVKSAKGRSIVLVDGATLYDIAEK